jgi:integral membrane sensor domain MASE1
MVNIGIVQYMLHYENKMESRAFCWVFNVFVAAVIFLTCKSGSLLDIQGLPLRSVVWPATGFSLAALLLFGFKALPGIFVGYFLYNFPHLYLHNNTIIAPLLTALVITFGSTLQASVGAFIIRRFSSTSYFTTAKDIIIFLIPAGFVTCMIASTISAISLYFFGIFSTWQSLLATWSTFWVGDTMGVYIFTPALVVWSIHKPIVSFKRHRMEAVGMLLSFSIISLLTFIYDIPIGFLSIPLSIWVTYRFHMHGATLVILMISLVTVIPTSEGYGLFVASTTRNQLLILITYLGCVVTTSLMFAAIIIEREAAWYLVRSHDIGMEESLAIHIEEMRQMKSEISVKEKLAALSSLMSSIARQLQVPLKTVTNFTTACLDCLSQIQNALMSKKADFEQQITDALQENFNSLKEYLGMMTQFETQAIKIAQIIEEHSAITASNIIKFHPIDIHSLLRTCLKRVSSEETKEHPDFTFSVVENLDSSIKLLIPLPEDLIHSFSYMLKNSFSSMREKKSRLGASFTPVLEVSTKERFGNVEIVIRDNGAGFTEERLKNLFQSFVTTKPLEELVPVEKSTDLGLSLAHDVIVYVHHGKIQIESKEGVYLQITISLPMP